MTVTPSSSASSRPSYAVSDSVSSAVATAAPAVAVPAAASSVASSVAAPVVSSAVSGAAGSVSTAPSTAPSTAHSSSGVKGARRIRGAQAVRGVPGESGAAARATGKKPELLRADGSPVRVLVVDDESSLADLLSLALRYEGWDIRSEGDGAGALRCARSWRPDAVLLDVMLPDMDGLTVLGRLRRDLPDVPVLFLTAKDAVEDRIAGLTAGGDDYVTKPFSLEEVVARLRGLLRRAGTAAARSECLLTVGDLVLDEDSHEVWRDGQEIHLTATEFELLRYLMRNPRRVLSKTQILDRVWSYDFGGQANVVELYISYLRRKIDAGREPMIHTRRGAGYLIKPGG